MNRKLKLLFSALALMLPLAACDGNSKAKKISYNDGLQMENFRITSVFNSTEDGDSTMDHSYIEYTFDVRNTGNLVCGGFDFKLNFKDSVGNLLFEDAFECRESTYGVTKSELYFEHGEISTVTAVTYGNKEYAFTKAETYSVADFSFAGAFGFEDGIVYSTESTVHPITISNLRASDVTGEKTESFVYRIDFNVNYEIPNNKKGRLVLANPSAKLILGTQEYRLDGITTVNNELQPVSFAYVVTKKALDMTQEKGITMKAAVVVSTEARLNYSFKVNMVSIFLVIGAVLAAPIILAVILALCFRKKKPKKEKMN